MINQQCPLNKLPYVLLQLYYDMLYVNVYDNYDKNLWKILHCVRGL